MCPSCSPFFLPRLHIDGIGADSSEKLSQFGTISIFVRGLRDFVDFRSLTSEWWTHDVGIRNAVDGFELLGAVPLGGVGGLHEDVAGHGASRDTAHQVVLHPRTREGERQEGIPEDQAEDDEMTPLPRTRPGVFLRMSARRRSTWRQPCPRHRSAPTRSLPCAPLPRSWYRRPGTSSACGRPCIRSGSRTPTERTVKSPCLGTAPTPTSDLVRSHACTRSRCSRRTSGRLSAPGSCPSMGGPACPRLRRPTLRPPDNTDM